MKSPTLDPKLEERLSDAERRFAAVDEELASPEALANPGRLADLGRAFDQAEQPDSAIHYLELYFSTRDIERLNASDNVVFWYAAPRLGELQAEHGDPERARYWLRLFLDATEEADPPYQAKRERIQELLEGLGG